MPLSKIGLTDEEIRQAIDEGTAKALSCTYKKAGLTNKEYNAVKVECVGDAVAKAQLEKDYNWGNEDCPHGKEWKTVKHFCPICWQSPLDEVA